MADVQVANGRITSVSATSSVPTPNELNATGCLVLPGFVDIHVHGAVGHDVMDADPPGLLEMARFFARHGVTAFMPTTMTASPEETLAAVVGVSRAVALQQKLDTAAARGARILGIHLEGPYISPQFPGAQLADQIRPPDLHEFATLAAAGPVRMITLAPEQPGAVALIEAAHQRGITTVYGHTAATYEECQAAIDWGVHQATHTYNAMTGLHHRRPGALGATLSDGRVYAQLIADTIHVHPAAMNILARCKGAARTVLITDAMQAAGLPDGQYALGGQDVFVQEGECRLTNGALAGSVLTMDRALGHFLAAAGQPLAELWAAASRTPAMSVGLNDEIGALLPGYRADFVLLDEETLEVVATIVGGEIAYHRDSARWDTAGGN
ncbi:MAG: N-acetylglucosamine-6-phosphate deacetylase [Caldilineaceae bacterium]